MARDRQYRAPREFGAWVHGRYYAPGELMPLGTTRYRVTAIESYDGSRQGFRTVSEIFEVGTTFAEIEDEIGAMFEELWEEHYGIKN